MNSNQLPQPNAIVVGVSKLHDGSIRLSIEPFKVDALSVDHIITQQEYLHKPWDEYVGTLFYIPSILEFDEADDDEQSK